MDTATVADPVDGVDELDAEEPLDAVEGVRNRSALPGVSEVAARVL
ncbi:MAG: hypothetical protein ACK5N0_04230 [Synechococcaceae cyanobacterium]